LKSANKKQKKVVISTGVVSVVSGLAKKNKHDGKKAARNKVFICVFSLFRTFSFSRVKIFAINISRIWEIMFEFLKKQYFT